MGKKSSGQGTRQMQIILFLVAGALLLPLALLGYGLFKEVKNREISKTTTAIVDGLRESIESAANKEWEDFKENDKLLKSVALQVEDPQKSATEISELATRLGGQVTLSLPEENAASWRMLIQVPKSKEPLLLQLLNLATDQNGPVKVPESPQSENSGEEMQNIEVRLQK